MKKRTLWIAVAAVVVIILLLLFFPFRNSVRSGLGEKVEAAKNSFYEGIPGSGDSAEAPYTALSERLSAANDLLNLAAKYDAVYTEYSGLRTAYNSLMNLLKDKGALSEIKSADEALTEAVAVCAEPLQALTEGKAAEALATALQTLETAEERLAVLTASYNAYISDFTESTLSSFPNRFLKLFLSDPEPELWP